MSVHIKKYRGGIDIGSTTVKLVLIDEDDNIVFGKYRRHQARTQETLAELLREARETVGESMLSLRMTGSGALNLGQALGVPFVQEVVAVASALKKDYPRVDVAIELGGEDAKIIYFKGGMEERMNGVCAGGTGAFIDQMASLLQTDADANVQQGVEYTCKRNARRRPRRVGGTAESKRGYQSRGAEGCLSAVEHSCGRLRSRSKRG